MEAQTTEYATEPVPDDSTVAWFRVAMVAAMVSFSLPTFLTGLELSAVTSPRETANILLAGSLILTVLGSLTAAIGSSTRLSSYMLNRIAFGSKGAAIVNLAFAVSLLGWFGVNIDLFSGAAVRLAMDLFGYELPVWLVELFAGLIMTVTTFYGFRAINMLSALLVPVLMVVTVMLISGSLAEVSLADLLAREGESAISFGDGVSSVVGAIIVGAVILPDITRFIRHWRGAVYTIVISYLVVNLTVMAAGAIAGAALGDSDLLNIMIILGIGWAAFAVVILGSWVLNSLNLYSTMLSVESTAPGLNYHVLIMVSGALGTFAAFFNILDVFLSFLFYLSIVFVPVAGVIAVDYLLMRRSAYHEARVDMECEYRGTALASWAVGACVALAGDLGLVTLSGMAAVDAMLIAALAYYLICKILARRGPAPIKQGN
ncbi:cytosine permease [Halioglobus maricola]|uniref:Cytosine permease n=1 Tax=Halioglobus maricola TaxID=2601894 RepID=A0A5P9NHD2_9GAMM|nr:cytosine permease [Halioglobus maricola]QFU75237.1 cytosine permease [Halioglobus maricola]